MEDEGKVMPRPFELTPVQLQDQLEDMVTTTFEDLQSQFLILPKGSSFIEYAAFQDAYEVLRRSTDSFANLTDSTVWDALKKDALSLVVLRTILGISPPEWAAVARTERGSDVDQGYARGLDIDCRVDRHLFQRLSRPRDDIRLDRTEALVNVAIDQITHGVPTEMLDETSLHRLAKFDTQHGLRSLEHAALNAVPYPVLLYERYLGRPFASHRDSVSGLVGNVMENAVAAHLDRARIPYHKTKRAERIPGYEQAPDFFIPNEISPGVLIEAKITSDDGTARDKVTRILYLAAMRDKRIRDGDRSFQVVACIDGRGFGVRREDMRRVLRDTYGKVFTLATLDRLIDYTDLKNFLPTGSSR